VWQAIATTSALIGWLFEDLLKTNVNHDGREAVRRLLEYLAVRVSEVARVLYIPVRRDDQEWNIVQLALSPEGVVSMSDSIHARWATSGSLSSPVFLHADSSVHVCRFLRNRGGNIISLGCSIWFPGLKLIFRASVRVCPSMLQNWPSEKASAFRKADFDV
jgi:hypothetical protein